MSDFAKLVDKLSPHAKQSLQNACELAHVDKQKAVMPEHMLRAMLQEKGSDCRAIAAHSQVDPDRIAADLEESGLRGRAGDANRLPSISQELDLLIRSSQQLCLQKLGSSTISTGAIFLSLIKARSQLLGAMSWERIAIFDYEALLANFHNIVARSMESGGSSNSQQVPTDGTETGKATNGSEDSALHRFCKCLTMQARSGEFDPVFGRDQEIELVAEILGRRRKNNPILVGDPGVGKTAVVEGLSQLISEGQVLDSLAGVELWELDMGALAAGASVKGEFERRLKAVIDEASDTDKSIVLFIDEAHTLVGAGNGAGGSDASNLLKPMLARGKLRTIAATTWTEYKKYFEKDAALSRRFQLVKLEEPSVELAADILRSARDAYESAHQVIVLDGALSSAASLSARYLPGRKLPDKAFDVLDTACVRVARNLSTVPAFIHRLSSKQIVLRAQLDALVRDQKACGEIDPSLIDQREQELVQLQEQIAQAQSQWSALQSAASELLAMRESDHSTPDAVRDMIIQIDQMARSAEIDFSVYVDDRAIANVISDWTGVPASALGAEDAQRALQLESVLKTRVRGQDAGIEIISRRLRAARVDFLRPDMPNGAFLLAGSSGVGKTETAIAVAEFLYGGKQFMTVINMSEYQEKHTISRLIGSPPGYVGYGEGGVLSEALRRQPYQVVLLDEVEKAHPDVLNLFYQVFDTGEFSDGEGQQVNCRNATFFLTSNLGSETLLAVSDQHPNATHEQVLATVKPDLLEFFKPALLARMSLVCYMPLTENVLKDIIVQKLNAFAKRLHERHRIDVQWDEGLYAGILAHCGHAHQGARMIEQVIERWITSSVANEMLERIAEGVEMHSVYLLYDEQQGFGFAFEPENADNSAEIETVEQL